MENNKYELTVVFDGQLEQNEVDEKVEQIEKLIKEYNGEVVQKDLLGKRRLAYEIKKKQYGYYVYFLIESDGSNNKAIEKYLRLNEHVIRYLTVRLDKKAIASLDRKAEKAKKAKAEAEAIKANNRENEDPEIKNNENESLKKEATLD